MPTRTTPALSRQQHAVLSRIAEGATTAEIAADRQLSPYTVKEYVAAVLRRLDARNRTEAVRLGLHRVARPPPWRGSSAAGRGTRPVRQ